MPRRRTVTGRIVRALLIGVVLTILLAWTAMFVPRGKHGYGPPVYDDLGLTMSSDGYRIWQISEGRNWWHHVVTYWHMQVSGHSIMIRASDYEEREFNLDELRAHLRPDSLDDMRILAWYREVGFPFPALTCSTHWERQIVNEDVIYSVRNGYNLGRDEDYEPLALPLVPVWPGFTLNVMFWGGVWLLPWGLGAIRHWRRRRMNLCEHCRYSREGISKKSVCPECGHPPLAASRGQTKTNDD